MTEYWLQKKTIGGWSQVTWYSDYEQAKLNYDSASKGNSGYSWRICKVEMIEQKLLEDTVEVKPPDGYSWSDVTEEQKIEMISNAGINAVKSFKSGWDNVHSKGWGVPEYKEKDWDFAKPEKEHGMTGKVWMINHTTKQKARITAALVEQFELNGWERGGPKTVFRS